MSQPDEPLGRMFALTHKVVHATFDAALAEHGASLTTWIVLRHAIEGPFSQRELATEMNIEAPTLVRHLDRMEREGLVERHRDPHDRRVIRVKVTRAGRQLHDRLQHVMVAQNDELRALLSANEERVLTKVLRRLYDHYTSHEGEAGVTRQA